MWLWQDTIYQSKFNGKVKLRQRLGQTAVWVDGAQQSGRWVEKIWKKGTEKLPIDRVQKVLILGLGCGSAISPLIKKFPQAKITGVEIDPVMIRLGRKYFGLDKARNLEIMNADASKIATDKKYDLILVDLYRGNTSPREFTTKTWLRKCSRFLTPKGLIIFNLFRRRRLHLERYFQVWKEVKVDFNTLVYCRKRIRRRQG